MQSTTNYGLNIVEGTDIVNPLTQFNPNFTNIDTIMKNNADASIDHATCIKTGTVHAVTRTNTDANVFRFTATGNWNTGDTMTVDGTLVSVYVSDGTAPSNGCFVINTEVLASIQGTRVTLYVNSGDASNISFDDTGLLFTANNVQDAVELALEGKVGKTTYSFNDCIFAGHNSGSGNFLSFFIPCQYDTTIASINIANTSLFTAYGPNNFVIQSGFDLTSQALSKTPFGLQVELKYSTTQAANVPVTIRFGSSDVTFS